MKALITGISGFAGSHLAELLIEKAIQIKGLLNHLLELSSRKVEKIKDPNRMKPSGNPIL